MSDCPLCRRETEVLLWQDGLCRVISVAQAGYTGFCRVIWHAHVREMTDLAPVERAHLMRVVWTVEAVQRDVLRPDKVNLASLGNVVPHLHWHVIPRYQDDPHFPDPIWAAPRREIAARAFDEAAYTEALRRHLTEATGPGDGSAR